MLRVMLIVSSTFRDRNSQGLQLLERQCEGKSADHKTSLYVLRYTAVMMVPELNDLNVAVITFRVIFTYISLSKVQINLFPSPVLGLDTHSSNANPFHA